MFKHYLSVIPNYTFVWRKNMLRLASTRVASACENELIYTVTGILLISKLHCNRKASPPIFLKN